MERRKFITGLGALATGSAAAMGTGAFSSVEANRSVTVNTADDDSAYLRLTAGDTDYVVDDSDSGQLTIDLGSPTVDDDGDSEGEGFNENAITFVHNVVDVENQGNNTVDVSFLNDSDNSVSERELTVDAGKATFSFDGGREDLEPGESVHIDVEVDTTVSGDNDGATLTIMADSV